MKLSSLIHVLPRLSRGKALLAGSALVVVSVAGAAIAASFPASTSAVSASFTATTVTNKNVSTCTGADGTYEYTQATYAGTATSTDPHLSGPITLDVSSVYNTNKNLGWISAGVQVASSTPGDNTFAKLSGVNANGTVQGFMTSGNGGREHGGGTTLFANVTGSFTGAGGFTAGSIGTGTATDTAIITMGSCNAPSSGGGGNENDDDSGGHGSLGSLGSSGTIGTGSSGTIGAGQGSIGSFHGLKHGLSLSLGQDD